MSNEGAPHDLRAMIPLPQVPALAGREDVKAIFAGRFNTAPGVQLLKTPWCENPQTHMPWPRCWPRSCKFFTQHTTNPMNGIIRSLLFAVLILAGSLPAHALKIVVIPGAAPGWICAWRGGGLVGSLNRRSFAERFNLRGGFSVAGSKVFAVWSGAELPGSGRSETEKCEVFAVEGRNIGAQSSGLRTPMPDFLTTCRQICVVVTSLCPSRSCTVRTS